MHWTYWDVQELPQDVYDVLIEELNKEKPNQGDDE